MAIIKVAKGGRSLKSAIQYIDRKAELKSGKDCADDKEQALKDMQQTKELYNKTDGRQYKHYIQSFSPNETTREQAHKIGNEWAEKNFKGHEVFVATHTDKNHIHNHFIVNSVNFENGKKIHLSKNDLNRMKTQNDKICEREGLSRPKPMKDKEIRSFNQGKYQLFKRIEQGENVKSYVLNTAIAVEKSTQKGTNRAEFIENMKKQGYEVNWKDSRKNITFTTPEGKKVRNSNLEKTFKDPSFSKEGLERGFRKPKEKSRTFGKSERIVSNIIKGTIKPIIRIPAIGLSKLIGTGIIRAIQSKVRDVKERTDKAVGSTGQNNNRAENSRADSRTENASRDDSHDR